MSSSRGQPPVPLPSQVGGHPGVLTTEDGSLIFKAALPNEIAFYQHVASDPTLIPLRESIPRFYGTLWLEGKVDAGSQILDANSIQPVKTVEANKDDLRPSMHYTQSIVLENLCHSFLKPNVLDIKLGTVLYDEDATPEKRARMERAARESTSGETGIRLTAFQVYDLATDQPVVTPKTYGRSLKPAELPDGVVRFFPIASATPNSASSPPSIATGLPADILLPLLSDLRSEVQEIHDMLTSIDFRMVGASLLIIYEADWERAREGLRVLHEETEESEDSSDDEEGSEDSSDDEEDSDGTKPLGPPFVVKLIDFAHTKLCPGQGPDHGVLLGLQTTLKLLDGRIEQTKIASKAS